MTPDQFTTLAAEIPYRPQGANAMGLLAPLVRSMGHILFLLACVAHEDTNPTDPPNPILSPEEKQNELTHAKDHLPPLVDINESPVLSALAKTNIITYYTLINTLNTDWAGWDHNAKMATLRSTANATAALAAFLDQELAGFRSDQSDPGTSL
jgi:hypothetical protein